MKRGWIPRTSGGGGGRGGVFSCREILFRVCMAVGAHDCSKALEIYDNDSCESPGTLVWACKRMDWVHVLVVGLS